MGPTWGPFGANRTQVDPMLAPWTLLSGMPYIFYLPNSVAVYDIMRVIYKTILLIICSWNPPHWRQGPVKPVHSVPQLLMNFPRKEPEQIRNHVISLVYPEYSNLNPSHHSPSAVTNGPHQIHDMNIHFSCCSIAIKWVVTYNLNLKQKCAWLTNSLMVWTHKLACCTPNVNIKLVCLHDAYYQDGFCCT